MKLNVIDLLTWIPSWWVVYQDLIILVAIRLSLEDLEQGILLLKSITNFLTYSNRFPLFLLHNYDGALAVLPKRQSIIYWS